MNTEQCKDCKFDKVRSIDNICSLEDDIDGTCKNFDPSNPECTVNSKEVSVKVNGCLRHVENVARCLEEAYSIAKVINEGLADGGEIIDSTANIIEIAKMIQTEELFSNHRTKWFNEY